MVNMIRMSILVLSVAGTILTASVPSELPEPGELALMLNEEEFEDYLDMWLAVEQKRNSNATVLQARSGCQFLVNGHLGQPQPVYIHKSGYPVPRGNTGVIHIDAGEDITIACTGPGRTIRHPQISANVHTATAHCVSGAQVSGPGWLNGHGDFGGLTCSADAHHTAELTNQRCFNNFRVIRVGFTVDNVFYPKFFSCFDSNRMEVLYTWAYQNPSHAVHQSGVDRPSWLAGSFFPGVNINNLYTQNNQRNVLTQLVGPDLTSKYITSSQFLARGHLVAKSDMIFATGQRSTFYFINAAPQWQPFNAGNWNWLEQNLRARIGEAGYHTTIYTGTFGVSQLRHKSGRLVDFYLQNNKQLPVPLYFYKVVYDSSRRRGTAFISINNPYYTLAEVRELTFCADRCRNNSAFSWLRWQPDRIDIGYSFCCDVNDFRRTIPHLPAFTVNGLLT